MTDNSKTFKIITLGCKVNQYESAYFSEALTRAGWRAAGRDELADAVIVNTCIVTQRAAHQSRQAIRKAIRENPRSCVGAVGCYAQVFPEELAEIEHLGLIADNRMKAAVPGLLLSIVSGRQECRSDEGRRHLKAEHRKRNMERPTSHGTTAAEQRPPSVIQHPASRTTVDVNAGLSFQPALLLKGFEPDARFDVMDISCFPGRARAYLKIQDGCESFCTYCIVPFARGPLRSLDPTRVIGMLARMAEQGYGEVVLTGIHLGKYGVDLEAGRDLVSLLRQIGDQGFPLRIRLSSLEPNEITRELIDMAAFEPWLCPHFHIPLQGGDDRILHRMGRHYTVRDFACLVEAIHAGIPHAAIGADVMVGFPGEDKTAHDNTCGLLRSLPVSYLHVFPFSPRPGTPASRFRPRVSPEEIKDRAARLRTLGEEKRLVFWQGCLNREFTVLPETWASRERRLMQGRSDNYLPVFFPVLSGSAKGPFQVRMEGIQGARVAGRIVENHHGRDIP